MTFSPSLTKCIDDNNKILDYHLPKLVENWKDSISYEDEIVRIPVVCNRQNCQYKFDEIFVESTYQDKIFRPSNQM